MLEPLEERTLPSFTAPVLYDTPPLPHAVAVGDFTGDGYLDIVTANAAPSNSVSIFLGHGDGTFAPARTFPAGANPANVAVADFNSDGNLDLAVTDYDAGTVTILFGNGDGTFRLGGTYDAGPRPLAIAAANFNGDGLPDLVVTDDAPANQLVSLPNNGRGGFPFSARYPAGRSPQAITVGDFNGDGYLDVVTADAGDQEVRWYAGNGDATFQPGLPFVTGLAQDVATADFTGNGKLDLATAGGDALAGLGLSPGNGNGTFRRTVTFPVEQGTTKLAVADFNGDGLPDVVTVDRQTDNLSLLYNYGGFALQAAASFPAGPGSGANPVAVAVGDFTGNGYPDLAVADQSFNYLAVLLDRPEVTHLQVTAPATGTAGSPSTITVTALDAGGIQAPQYQGTVHFTSTDGNAVLPADYTFTAADHGTHTFSVTFRTAGAGTVTAADTNDQSIAGSATVAVSPAAVSSLLVRGFPFPTVAGTSGTFTVTAEDPYGNTATGYTGTVHFTSSDSQAVLPINYTFTAADLGSHPFTSTLKTAGTQALTAADTASSAIAGSQTGIAITPAAATRLTVAAPPSAEANSPFATTVSARDAYNNVATDYTGTVHFSSSDPKAVLPGDYTFTAADAGLHTFTISLVNVGAQTLTARDLLNPSITGNASVAVSLPTLFGPPLSLPAGARPRGVATGDFNGDGNQDVAIVNESSNSYNIFLGNGDGSFRSAGSYPLGQTPVFVVAADLRGDGNVDLVAALQGANAVAVLLGNGDGTFQAPVTYPVGSGPGTLAVADLTGNGIPDIVVPNQFSRTVSILLGDGTGRFTPGTSFTVPAAPWWVSVADLNGDGIPDLALTIDTSSVNLYFGRGDGTFTPGTILSTDANPRSIGVADFNGDGILDLAVADYESGSIMVFQGNGNGTFRGPDRYTEGNQGPWFMTVADLTGDGRPDIVTADQGLGLYVLQNQGDGQFQPPVRYTTGSLPLAVVTADFNNDGATDLVTADGFSNDASVLLNLAPARSLEVLAPDTVAAGAPFVVTLSALNAFGGPATGYLGTVHFTSTDPAATLPRDYTFTAADHGVHTFPVTLSTPGDQHLTTQDTLAPLITGSATITVTAPESLAPMMSGRAGPSVYPAMLDNRGAGRGDDLPVANQLSSRAPGAGVPEGTAPPVDVPVPALPLVRRPAVLAESTEVGSLDRLLAAALFESSAAAGLDSVLAQPTPLAVVTGSSTQELSPGRLHPGGRYR